MDREWEAEVSGLPLEKQWDKLYEKKILLRPTPDKALWGHGNAIRNSESLREFIPMVLKDMEIKSFIDCGCGDFFWMSKIDWTGVDYLGIDIVGKLIERNKKVFPGYNFRQLNIVDEVPPKADIIFLRSVFIHLALGQCLQAIENIKKSGCKYIMASTVSEKNLNRESSCLMLKQRNLLKPPFNFKKLIKIIPDMGENHFMGIWRVDEI